MTIAPNWLAAGPGSISSSAATAVSITGTGASPTTARRIFDTIAGRTYKLNWRSDGANGAFSVGKSALRWNPPAMSNPTIVDLNTTDAKTVWVFADTEDVIFLPKTGQYNNERLQTNGGRNIIIKGGHYRPLSSNSAAAFMNFTNNLGGVWLEGVYVDMSGVGERDAIGYFSPPETITGTVTVTRPAGTKAGSFYAQNCRFANIQGTDAGTHGDVFQPQGDIENIGFYNCWMSTQYQSLLLHPRWDRGDGDTIARADLERVTVKRLNGGDATSKIFYFAETETPQFPCTLKDVWGEVAETATIKAETHYMWPPEASAVGARRSGNQVSWSRIDGFITVGVGPDYVPESKVGLNYVSDEPVIQGPTISVVTGANSFTFRAVSDKTYVQFQRLSTGPLALTEIALAESAPVQETVPLTDLGSVIKATVDAIPDTNFMTDGERSKLAGVQDQATKNQTDIYLLDRTNHTGNMPMANVTGLADALASAGGGGGGNSFRPQTYSGSSGTGKTGTQRQANASAILQTIAAAAAGNGIADLTGDWEVDGTITVSGSNYIISGGGGRITQYGTVGTVLNFDNAADITVSKLTLNYGTAQGTGSDPATTTTFPAAIKLNNCTNIRLQDVVTQNARTGLGLTGTNVGHQTSGLTVRQHPASSFGVVVKPGASGLNFRGVAVTGTDTTCAGGALIEDAEASDFQIRVSRLVCARAIWMIGGKGNTLNNPLVESITPVPSAGYAGVIHIDRNAHFSVKGGGAKSTKLSKTVQGVDFANIFAGGGLAASATAGCGRVTVDDFFVSGTTKAGITRFGLIGALSGNPPVGLQGWFDGIDLDTSAAAPHRLDDLCFVTMAPNSLPLNGPLCSFNQTIGKSPGGFVSWSSEENPTIYTELHGPWQRVDTPLTNDMTFTLQDRIAPPYGPAGDILSPRVPVGTVLQISRSTNAYGVSGITAVSESGTPIGTLAPGQTAYFVMAESQEWSGLGRATF